MAHARHLLQGENVGEHGGLGGALHPYPPLRVHDQTLSRAEGSRIETAQALANLDRIVQTPGLSGVYVGPGDLSLSLTGRATLDFRGESAEAVARVAEVASRHGLIPGIFTPGGELARHALELGYRFVTAGSDFALLSTAARGVVTDLRPSAVAPSSSSLY
ncbi:aldolase/citrate lyase family protein [Deinococcus hohokamensis]|uniref:Aldolase/citrate lyase family protein n=1 Tax=Deinococcus hohokamensis TaxID=309883 RepID=A0ABV9IDC2_9DEIO